MIRSSFASVFSSRVSIPSNRVSIWSPHLHDVRFEVGYVLAVRRAGACRPPESPRSGRSSLPWWDRLSGSGVTAVTSVTGAS